MSKSSQKTLRWATIAVVAAAVLGAAWWWFGKAGEPEVSYRTAKIERGPLQAAVAATGTVNPVSQVQVGTQVSGQIRELLVDFNSEVRRDQLIARIDPETFEYRVRQATADLEAARASVLTAQANVQQALAQSSRAQVELQEAQRDLERKQGLVAQGFISPAEADAVRAKVNTLAEAQKAALAQVAVARAQAQTAAATVKQREAQLAQAKVDLERTQIRSPVDGIVIKRAVEVGQTVAASLQTPELFVIARNLSDMQVEASIDEADVSRVRLDQKVSFTVDAFPGRTFEGLVRQVRKAAVSSQNVVTYVAVIGFTNTGGNLLPGMTANVRIVTDTRDNALKVPNAALRVRIAGVEPTGAASAPAQTGQSSLRWLAPLSSLVPSAHAQGAPGGGGARLRERLIQELSLNEPQQAQLNTILDELRPQFMALRELSDDERPAAREKVMAQVRERVDKILDADQRKRYAELVAQARAGRPDASASAPVARAAPARVAGASSAPERARAPSSASPTASSVTANMPAPRASAPAGSTVPPAPSGNGGAGPLRDFRERLVRELQLTAAQQEKVDAILDTARPQFMQLRDVPEEDRTKARERILADLRARIADQLSPEQKPRYQQLVAELASRQTTRGRIFILDAGGKPRAFDVRLGITDGVMTELLVAPGSPAAQALTEGAIVITAVVGAQAQQSTSPGARPATMGPRMPF